MRQLLPYYEAELHFIREMAKEFARTYSKIAGRLQLEDGECEDPHVERLIQAFALLTGRIRQKIEDEYPEITEALLGLLYPHYLRPIPSMVTVQFELDPTQGKISGGYPVPRGTPLYTRAVSGAGAACRFRTCYPVALWPLRIHSAQIGPAAMFGGPAAGDAAAMIRLRIECLGDTNPAAMGLNSLRFHLRGNGHIPHTLYELILNNTRRVLLSTGGDVTQPLELPLPDGCVRPVGFERDENLLPYPDRSFTGYGLLQEYFCFPEKYLFFDLTGFDRVALARFGRQFEIVILLGEFERADRLRSLEQAVTADNFLMGCTPAINLFQRTAEPIRLTQTTSEYHVIPDLHSPLAAEIYSIDRVTSTAPYLQEPLELQPFYSLRHSYHDEASSAFWYSRRRSSSRKGDNGTEVLLSLVDLEFRPTEPGIETLTVHTTITNRDLPAQLPLTQRFGELSIETGSTVRARTLAQPTEAIRPPLGSGLQWRLISHLALNYLSLVEGGREALQEILKLYDFRNSPAVRNEIAGIVSVSSSPHAARVAAGAGLAFCQGMRVDIEFDEEKYVGSSAFLMASVLERFLGLYSSINSFCQLTATTRQRKEVLRRWPPRAGEQILL